MQEVEQTVGILTFCVDSLVILQTRGYEQHATNLTKLQNGVNVSVAKGKHSGKSGGQSAHGQILPNEIRRISAGLL